MEKKQRLTGISLTVAESELNLKTYFKNLKLSEQTSQSSDLNITENLWADLKHAVWKTA